jgi:hypothetical protein
MSGNLLGLHKVIYKSERNPSKVSFASLSIYCEVNRIGGNLCLAFRPVLGVKEENTRCYRFALPTHHGGNY